MLDAHFHFGGKKIAIGAEPDLWTSANGPRTGGRNVRGGDDYRISALERIETDEVLIGDLRT